MKEEALQSAVPTLHSSPPTARRVCAEDGGKVWVKEFGPARGLKGHGDCESGLTVSAPHRVFPAICQKTRNGGQSKTALVLGPLM